jgi:SAM-dependent methyltransferase
MATSKPKSKTSKVSKVAPAKAKPSAKPKTSKPVTKAVRAPQAISNKISALDIGCGASPRNPFNAEEVIGVDLKAAPGVKAVDLVIQKLPFKDNSFDFVTAFDVLQTIPRLIYNPKRRMPFVELMSEIFRVLKPGGLFLSVTPVYPKDAAFRDPGHVNYITAETFTLYFDAGNNWAAGYGFKGGFNVESQEWSGEHHLVTNLRKPAA